MSIYQTEPPYYLRSDGQIKLPTPTDEEATEFLRAAVRMCFRSMCGTGFPALLEYAGSDSIPVKSEKTSYGYEYMCPDFANMTDKQYGDLVSTCAKAMYDQIRLSAVWNPVLTKAVRAAGNFSPEYIGALIKDVFTPGRGYKKSERTDWGALDQDQSREHLFEFLGETFGKRMMRGAISRLSAWSPEDTVGKSIEIMVKEGKVDPSLVGLVTVEDAAEICPPCAEEMTKKGLRFVPLDVFAKALDIEIAHSLGDPGLFNLLMALNPEERILAKSQRRENPAIAGWARKMRKEGGKHPFTWCVNAVKGKVGDPKAFCARAHIAAFGATPMQRKKGYKKGAPAPQMLDSRPEAMRAFVNSNYPLV